MKYLTIIGVILFFSCNLKPKCSEEIRVLHQMELSDLELELFLLKDSLKREEIKKQEKRDVDSVIKKNKLLSTNYGDFIDWDKKTNKYASGFTSYQEMYFYSQFLDLNLIGDSEKSQIEQLQDIRIYISEKSN